MTDDKGAGEGPYKYEQGSILGLDHNPCLAYHPSVEHYVECLNEAYATGRKAERERCAKIAESHVTKFNGFQIADAIRGGQDGK